MTVAKSLPQIVEPDPHNELDQHYWDTWVPEPPPTDLIFDDGEPLESNQHRITMSALISSIQYSWHPAQDFFVGGNMFIYFSRQQVMNKKFRGPDFFVVLNAVGASDRKGWLIWEEGGRYPDIIIELLSDSTAKIDKTEKKDLYEQVFRTPNYFIYDPLEPASFQGWHLTNAHYEPLIPNERGWLWSSSLQLWLGPWEGEIERHPGNWLRFFDREENLILLPNEFAALETQRANQAMETAQVEQERANQAIAQAELEKQRADRLAQKLQELGIELGVNFS